MKGVQHYEKHKPDAPDRFLQSSSLRYASQKYREVCFIFYSANEQGEDVERGCDVRFTGIYKNIFN